MSIEVEQNPSTNTVSFFHIPVEIQVRNGSQVYDFKLNLQQHKETFTIKPPFDADTLIFNPYYNWLASGNVKTSRTYQGKEKYYYYFQTLQKTNCR